MKQKPHKRRKQFRKPRKRSPPTPTPPLDWQTPLAEPTPIRGTPNPAMSGIVQPPPLPLREAADQGGLKGRTAEHEEMLGWIAVLERLIAELPEQRKGGPGHNRQPITQDDVQEIKRTIALLKALPALAPVSRRSAQRSRQTKQ
jgi:hypothetical protein